MNFKLTLLPSMIFMLLFGASTLLAAFQKNNIYNGFKLLDKRFIKEVNAECFYFEHIKSGAHLFKIAAQDANKTFSIAFKTVPEGDRGTPHIMEHAVLNGSKHFPVKSPFDVLTKGSLNTFLNAMTGKDITIYPVASMNDKDYFNLMNIYLDAVFYPLIYEDARILKQEGWHHELTDKEGEVVYKGVVYNEMKGAFSSPARELDYQLYKHLFPDNGYRYSSGGYPEAIPQLTNDDFLNFHRKYYHPSNSYIYLYGDADLQKELEFIDSKYLAGFDNSDVQAAIPLQKHFDVMKEVNAYYPVTDDASTENQTYLTMSFVAGLNTDQALVMALNMLTDVLVNQESAPVRLALQEAGIGREVNASVDDLQQNVFQITVQNANAIDKDKFRDVVMNTLRKAVEGLDKQAVEGTLNRMEFRLREGDDAQKGLTYNFRAISGWFFAGDPYLGLEYENPLAEIKTALQKGDYLETIIRKYMLDNTFALLLVMEPRPGMEKENNLRATSELTNYKAALSEQEIDSLVQSTQQLLAYQEREDTPEALATIPMLDLKDINPQAEWYDIRQEKIANTAVLFHKEFTSNVVYARFHFDTRVLPEELIPYSALLAEFLASLNTENYSYGDLDKALKIHTGGFSSHLENFMENREDSKLIPKFVIAAKVMNNKVDKLFELAGEIVNKTRYHDAERLKAVLTRHQSRLDDQIKRNGYGYARTRLSSYFSKAGLFEELTEGVEYYWFVSELAKNFDAKTTEISEKLSQTAGLLFSKGNLIVSTTCDETDEPDFLKGLEDFVQTLPDSKVNYASWELNLEKKNEGLLAASKVQYVLQGYDFKKLGYSWNGKMYVLDQILSRDWLQNKIRVMGGAYGGFSSFASTGHVYFASYRDPNLKETLDNYSATPEFLHSFDVDEKTMTRFIIGTIARLDRPLTPSEKGDLAVRRFFEKSHQQDVQSERDAVLQTTPQDIRQMEKIVDDILSQKAYCVYGNEEKIENNKELFNKIVNLNPR